MVAYPTVMVLLYIGTTIAKALRYSSIRIAGYANITLRHTFVIVMTYALQLAGYNDIKEQLGKHYQGKSGSDVYIGNSYVRAKLKYVPRKKRDRWNKAAIDTIYSNLTVQEQIHQQE